MLQYLKPPMVTEALRLLKLKYSLDEVPGFQQAEHFVGEQHDVFEISFIIKQLDHRTLKSISSMATEAHRYEIPTVPYAMDRGHAQLLCFAFKVHSEGVKAGLKGGWQKHIQGKFFLPY